MCAFSLWAFHHLAQWIIIFSKKNLELGSTFNAQIPITLVPYLEPSLGQWKFQEEKIFLKNLDNKPPLLPYWAFSDAPVLKNLATNAGDKRDAGLILSQEDPLEEEMATQSSILAWRIPWTEEPGRLWSTGWQRVGHNWSILACMHILPYHVSLKWRGSEGLRWDQIKMADIRLVLMNKSYISSDLT